MGFGNTKVGDITGTITPTNPLETNTVSILGSTVAGPANIVRALGSTTRMPANITMALGSTTRVPSNISMALGSTTRMPSNVSMVLGSTVAVPSNITTALGATTAMPIKINNALGSTSAMPSNITSALGATTAMPVSIINALGSTVAMPTRLTARVNGTTQVINLRATTGGYFYVLNGAKTAGTSTDIALRATTGGSLRTYAVNSTALALRTLTRGSTTVFENVTATSGSLDTYMRSTLDKDNDGITSYVANSSYAAITFTGTASQEIPMNDGYNGLSVWAAGTSASHYIQMKSCYASGGTFVPVHIENSTKLMQVTCTTDSLHEYLFGPVNGYLKLVRSSTAMSTAMYYMKHRR